jgi:hypothetical protein
VVVGVLAVLVVVVVVCGALLLLLLLPFLVFCAASGTKHLKWSQLASKFDEIVSDAVESHDAMPVVMGEIGRFLPPLPCKDAAAVARIEVAPLPYALDVRQWAASQSLAFKRLCDSNRLIASASAAVVFQVKGGHDDIVATSDVTQVWICGLIYKYQAQFMRADVDQPSEGGPERLQIRRPLIGKSAIDLFATFFSDCKHGFRVEVSFKPLDWITFGGLADLEARALVDDEFAVDFATIEDCTMIMTSEMPIKLRDPSARVRKRKVDEPDGSDGEDGEVGLVALEDVEADGLDAPLGVENDDDAIGGEDLWKADVDAAKLLLSEDAEVAAIAMAWFVA